jgi:small subunit ribosomal protein S21|tara:strand:+ start:161 stop:388 length:228 start_codon:yes stop_codon:yes gene_type:complete
MLITKLKKKQIEVTLISVKVHKGNVERALSKLKKKVKEEKLFLELKQREFYTKPSVIKREKRAKSKLRIKKLLQN